MSIVLAYIFYIIISVALGILVMIYGWGLEPASWWWILGVGIVGRLLWELVGKKLQDENWKGK